jgi:tRNA (mo5U34)-methyltransferase
MSDQHILEIGCFEGIHTVALSRYARQVTAIDARIENVVKTIVRCAMFGHHPTVFKCNVEERPLKAELLQCDIAFHVGVLYHLKDPVEHLIDLAGFTQRGVLLDTHYARDDEATERYNAGGAMVRYKKYREGGYTDPFSGVYDHAKWLRLDDITMLLRNGGFGNIEIVETRQERNGPRVLLIAERS